MNQTNISIALEKHYVANHYDPIRVVLKRGQGIYVWDIEDKQYIDCLSAYSAISHGHCHPRLVEALAYQAKQLTLTSRAFYHDQFGPFAKRACELMGQEKVLPMNTGAEAVETAIKAARKWAYTVKGVQNDQAEIIVCDNNFHGRTTTIISASSHPAYKAYFGPLTPGFVSIPYGKVEALEQAITPRTAAFLVEPIQGEGGIVVPPAGYLKACSQLCQSNQVLLIADEIQTGLGRTGAMLACEHEHVIPDGLILGKSLGGGLIPVSLFLSKAEVMDVFKPGDHGSTFGGNPLAAHVGLTALNLLLEEGLIDNANIQGPYLMEQLIALNSPLIQTIRGKGLLIGLEVNTDKIEPKALAHRFLQAGLLTKDTHHTVIRLAPPLTITRKQIDEVIARIARALA